MSGTRMVSPHMFCLKSLNTECDVMWTQIFSYFFGCF